MAEIFQLHNQVKLLHELKDETVSLIHHTTKVEAIKKLVEAYDIFQMNILVEKQFQNVSATTWDRAAFQDLILIRFDLLTLYAFAFDPVIVLLNYDKKLGTLFNVLDLKIKNTSAPKL